MPKAVNFAAYRKGREDGFSGTIDWERTTDRFYLRGATVGQQLYLQFINCPGDHVRSLVEAPLCIKWMPKIGRDRAPVVEEEAEEEVQLDFYCCREQPQLRPGNIQVGTLYA